MVIENSQRNQLCVICHQPINLNNFGQSRIILEQDYVGCPNAHLVHRECLKMWIVNSQNCPVCHEKYDMLIIKAFGDYLAQVKRDREEAETQRQLKESSPNETAGSIPFSASAQEKFDRAIKLVNEKNYTGAMNLLWDILDEEKFDERDPRHLKILLYLGIVYYEMGKGALAIRQLMKLVKIDYDYPLAFFYMGLCYESVELPEKSKWAYERAKLNVEKLIESNPEYYSPFLEQINEGLSRC